MRQHNPFSTNSGQYLDFLPYTSTSAVGMATSSAVPGAHGWALHVETTEVPVALEERQPAPSAEEALPDEDKPGVHG